MPARKLSNIPIRDFRKFLKKQGLEIDQSSKGRGGHEKWFSQGLDRPITLQSHIDPVPEHIVKQVLRHLGLSRKDFDAAFFDNRE